MNNTLRTNWLIIILALGLIVILSYFYFSTKALNSPELNQKIIEGESHFTLDDSKKIEENFPSTNTPLLSAKSLNKPIEDSTEPDGEFTAFLTQIENANSVYSISFDYVVFDTSATGAPKLINNNKKIRTFLVSPELEVGYDFANGLNPGEKYYSFKEYIKLLTIESGHYRNLKIYDDSYQHGGLYSIIIKGGLVIKMYEVGDFTRPQGTE